MSEKQLPDAMHVWSNKGKNCVRKTRICQMMRKIFVKPPNIFDKLNQTLRSLGGHKQGIIICFGG